MPGWPRFKEVAEYISIFTPISAHGRSAAVATDRSEGDIVVVGVEGDSVKSEGRTALLGNSGVVSW